ncbi:hypothetical protein J6590_094253 [Homalodisca vitripennis]|nr:hypothetical protein J6590_086922 [Homalodisca vitripennis]KAG8319328.1 hypothetical protein J6590_094253 [Homalodisca vitripennis]
MILWLSVFDVYPYLGCGEPHALLKILSLSSISIPNLTDSISIPNLTESSHALLTILCPYEPYAYLDPGCGEPHALLTVRSLLSSISIPNLTEQPHALLTILCPYEPYAYLDPGCGEPHALLKILSLSSISIPSLSKASLTLY